MPRPSSPYDSLSLGPQAPLTVSQVISLCNGLFAELTLLVEGEVASYGISQGKFVFFDLKDEEREARLSCFMMAFQLPFPLEDGMRVVVEARPGLHQKSGRFSLTVSRVEAKGQGSVKRAFELLRQKLQDEGLFEPGRKRSLPRFVERVGIISSAGAAGLGDFKTIAWQRLPGVRFLLANVAVQGREAEEQICQAFDFLNSRYQLDAIVLIRGGGSQEDLHAFNSEPVARAIVRSKVPVLVGVGHERDLTIADFCADVRAATPSNAAQILLPALEEVKEQVVALTQEGRRRVGLSVQRQREDVRFRLSRLRQLLLHRLQAQREAAMARVKTIEAVSPRQTLLRGYSLTCGPDGQLLRSAAQVEAGDRLTTRLADGTVHSTAA